MQNQNIHVIGIGGTEGSEIAMYLAKQGAQNLTLHDFATTSAFEKSLRTSHYGFSADQIAAKLNFFDNFKGQINYNDTYLNNIDQADLVFVPQSWHLYEANAPLKALQGKTTFSSITKLYFDLLPCPIIGITGSNGKTTTTNLVHHLAKATLENSARKVHLTGNDRYHQQLLQQIDAVSPSDLVIIEVSNRQLQIDLGRSPNIGILTNITPNHLDEYKDFDEYVQAKLSLFKYSTPDTINLVCQEDPVTKQHLSQIPNPLPFSTKATPKPGIYLENGHAVAWLPNNNTPISIPLNNFKLIGKHNQQNLLAAIFANILLGADSALLPDAIATFKAPPKRLEHIGTRNQINYYNDISSTVPDTTILDLQALNEATNLPTTLIMGGKNKEVDYTTFEHVIPTLVDNLIIIKSPICNDLNILKTTMGNRWHEVTNLAEAVKLDQKLTTAPHNLILAPTAVYMAYFKDKIDDYNRLEELI